MAFIRDVATVQNGADLTTGYALINGKRSVYIPVSKRSDASSWQVVQNVKKALPAMQAAVPDDIRVSYEFDQTEYLIKSLNSLLTEALLGALLTGLMVFLFLGDLRSAIIVVLTIPLALLGAVTGLWLTGQTLNLMTLGGLALAVGILVDEATVTIENIHRHQELGKPKRLAILEASLEISFPKLLILLCILMVFVPSFFMSGLPRAMFQPLAMAVGFAMIISFLLSQTFVPVISAWLLSERFSQPRSGKTFRIQQQYSNRITKWLAWKHPITISYILIFALLLANLFASIGTEIFPKADSGQFQFRLRLKAGTRMERTEEATREALMRIKTLAEGKVEITSAFVGAQPSSFPNNTIYLWTNGPYEAVVQVKLKDDSRISLASLREKIREDFSKNMNEVSISFEPADLVERVMSLGSTTPVDIAILGRNMEQSRIIAESLIERLKTLAFIRDLQIGIPLDYPSLKIDIDRERAGLLGLTIQDINNAIITATSSSRFVSPVYWLDSKTGNTYQIQVEFPQNQMNSIESLENIYIGKGENRLLLRDVAQIYPAISAGVYQRYNQQRMVNVTANLEDIDFGSAMKKINEIINTLGVLPPGTTILKKGQSPSLEETLSELKNGLLVALVAIFLLIAANFQSFRIGFVVLLSATASIAGALLLLKLTNQTLNIQSFTGTVMSLGVSVANAILMIQAAEGFRKKGLTPLNSISEAAGTRLRPILMTAVAMIAGMIPLSVGMGETGKQIVPLGMAVIGGLTLSTIITLWILPSIYGSFMTGVENHSISLLPGDEQ